MPSHRFFDTRFLYAGAIMITAIVLAAWLALSLSHAATNSCSTPSFAAVTNFATGVEHSGVAIADFNGDGKLDTAVTNLSANSVSVLLGNGAGGFGTPTSFAVGNTPRAVLAADLNGDGKFDLAVSNFGSNTVSVLLGDGTGSFGSATNFAVGQSPWSIAAGDFNGDGKVDLATPNTGNVSDVSVLIGTGSGSFAPAVSFSCGPNIDPINRPAPVYVAVADFNGDGKSDLAVANSGNTFNGVRLQQNVAILLGNGAGSFGPPTFFLADLNPRSLAVSDFNGDGKLDLAVANASNNVSILLGDGAGSFSAPTHFAAGAGPYALATADFNGDGKSDLAVSNQGGSSVSILLGDALGGFGPPTNQSVDQGPLSLATRDLNGNGSSDIVVATGNSVGVLLNTCPSLLQGVPNFTAATNFSVGSNPHSVSITDFDGDGKNDLAVSNSGSGNVSILRGTGAGNFSLPANFGVGATPVASAAGDFNGDTKPDLAVANMDSNNISVILGDGAGAFGAATNFAVGSHPRAVVTGDFNGDGKLDLATANNGSADISVLLGNGSGSFGPATSFAVGANPRSIAVGDFNKDGKADLAIANQASNSVSVLLGQGNGTFASAANFPTGGAPFFVAVGDVNTDTKPDLVLANHDTNDVSVLLGDGAGGFAAATNFAAGTGPYAVVIGDFYGDGKPDLAVSTSSAGEVAILVGNGTGGFGSPFPFAVGSDPRVLAAGDFDGDGKPDLAVPNFGSSNVSILINKSIVTARLSGVVRDTQGAHISGVNVTAIDSTSQQTIASTVSDASGNYSLLAPLGSYKLRATPPAGSSLAAVEIANIAITGDLVQDITLTSGVVLSGRILTRDGQPYANTEVTLQRSGFEINTRTAADGSYSLRVPPATYTLGVNYGSGQFNGTGLITLNTDTVRNIAIQERFISGIVKNSSGQPVAGVLVRGSVGFETLQSHFEELDWTIFSNTTTDSSGNYQLLLFPGTAAVTATPPANSDLLPQNFQLNLQNDIVQDITLQNGGVRFSGQVKNRDGQPFPGVDVVLQKTGIDVSVKSAADGSYSLQVPPGDYNLRVNYNAVTPAQNWGFSGGATLTLTQDTVRDFTIQNRVLSGTVRDTNIQPVTNTLVRGCFSTNFGGMFWNECTAVSTDTNGFYRGDFLTATIDLTVTPPPGLGLAPRLIFFDLQNDQTLDIALGPGARFSGHVTDRDGHPAPNSSINLQSVQSNDFGLQTQSGADGSFSLQVDPGNYQLSLSTTAAGVQFLNGTGTINIPQDTTRDFVIQNRTLSGTVRNPIGQGVPNTLLRACYSTSFDGLNWNACCQATTDANGSYNGAFVKGSFNLSLTPPPQSGLAGKIVTVDLQNDLVLDATLQSGTHAIRGRVLDNNGLPLTGVTVALTGGQSAISTTDGNGSYVFVNLSEGGNYTVTPSRTSYQSTPPNAVFNNLMGDQTANFTATLVTFNVTGHIRDGASTGVGGVTVTLSGATTAVTQTDNAGAYAFSSVAAFANYSVKPSQPSVTFTPARTDINNLSANQTADFTSASQPSPSPTPPLDDDFGNTQRNPDKFNFGSLSTDPTAFDPLVSVQQQNGHLEIRPRGNAFGTHYNGYTTVSAVDVNTSTPSVEVVQAAGEAQTLFTLGSDVNNNFGFLVQPANAPSSAKPKVLIPKDATAVLIFQITISGQLTAFSIPYDPVAHRFWRFRYEPVANAILFETSPDNITWTVQHSVVLQRSVTPMAIELSSGTSSTTTTPGTAVFDNFHLGDKFSIAGQVKTSGNAGVSGATISLSGSFARTLLTDANGNYSFAQLDAGGNYTVTPNLSGYTFSPISQIFNSLGTNKTADFVAAPASPTPTPTPGVSTPAGSNVSVQSNGAQITFAQVTEAGMTTVTARDPATMGQLPDGYFISTSGVGFDVTTTAAYLPPVDICFAVPAATDAAIFASLAVLHSEGGELLDRTTTRNFGTKSICGRVNSLSPFAVVEKTSLQFSSPGYSVSESAGSVAITVTRLGHLSNAASVNFFTSDGTAEQRSDYTAAADVVSFAAGETIKTLEILVTDDLYVEGNETLFVSLSNATGGAISGPRTVTLTITDNDATTATVNPLDNADAQFFVREHYYDFLSRAPDPGGLGFWAGTITQCGADQTCLRNKRIDASNAFFYELEFQQTGAYVFRLYRVAFGNNQPFPNPFADATHPNEEKKLPSYAAFVQDRARVVGGASLAGAQLELANSFVQRSEFIARYPSSLVNAGQFVDALLAGIQSDLGVNLSSQRENLISLYNSGGRGAVLYRLADDNAQGNPINNRPLIDAEYNRAFVATQYFGYLRRDADIGGFLFWLGQVSSAPPRDVAKQHAMVCSFITSGEYQQRFSPLAPHSNSECPH